MTTPSAQSIGIIGAGQLGFLLCEAARKLGISTLVVTPDAAAPARLAADHSIVAPLDDPGLAEMLAERVDAVTFEIEAVPDILLDGLAALQKQGQITVSPDPGVLNLLKNKARQKDWLADQGFPTLPYKVLEQPEEEQESLLQSMVPPLVQKAQQGGYDGYGVQVLPTMESLKELWSVPSIFEPFLDRAREIAVLAARGAAGDVETYAPADLRFDPNGNILDIVVAPADLPAEVETAARALAANIVKQLGGVGIFAVEMFVTADGGLLVNEISPRVHNAGHHTVESCVTSQFAQHVRAVAGLPLGAVEQTEVAVMKNLLYTDDLAHLCSHGPGVVAAANDAVAVHWYGKREPRPGRKMGHVTYTGADAAQAEQQIAQTLADLAATDSGTAA